jgi:hypothetical protein
MTRNVSFVLTLVILTLSLLFAAGCAPKVAMDEPKQAGKTAADFPELALDLFKDMDGGIELTPDEVKGRNTWVLWTGGNEAFWDYLANHSFGALDLLKALDTR